MGTMPDLYNYLSNPVEGKGLVDLYIGSHMHQYERIYPYVSGQFVIEPSPYTRGRLVSVVEAVGGVDYFIIEEYYKPEYFSAYATYNLTGLAILTFTGRAGSDDYAMNYKHYVTVPLCTLVD